MKFEDFDYDYHVWIVTKQAAREPHGPAYQDQRIVEQRGFLLEKNARRYAKSIEQDWFDVTVRSIDYGFPEGWHDAQT